MERATNEVIGADGAAQIRPLALAPIIDDADLARENLEASRGLRSDRRWP
jgi:hypothetical protein